jgi:hypothetical protein
MKQMIRSVGVAVAVALVCTLPSAFSSDLPVAVRKSVDAHASGGKIVRWQRAGANYQAIINKNGQETGVELSADGRVLGTIIRPCGKGSWATTNVDATNSAEKKTRRRAPRSRQ